MTAVQALKHEWLSEVLQEEKVDEQTEALKKFLQFKKTSQLRMKFLEQFVGLLDNNEQSPAKLAFQLIDDDFSGQICRDELEDAVRKSKITENRRPSAIKNAFEAVDFDKSGKVSYTEFLAASLSPKALGNEKKLREVFNFMDITGQSSMSTENVAHHFSRQAKKVTQGEVADMFEQAGLNPCENITYEQFKEIMKPESEVEKEDSDESEEMKIDID